jgi:hypothetical protein
MSPSICPRCALNLSRTSRISLKIQFPQPRSIRCATTTSETPSNAQSIKMSFTNPSTEIQLSQQLQHLFQTLESFPETPYPTITLNRSFATTANPIITPLLRALEENDNGPLWERYVELRNNGDLKYLNRPHFSQVIRCMHPVRRFHGAHTDARSFINRIEDIKSDMRSFGYTLTQADWGHVIDCARAMRKQRPDQIHKWWAELMASGVRPDIWAYNHYLASLCGTSSELQNERPPRFHVAENGEIKPLGKGVAISERVVQREPIIGMSSIANATVRDMVSQNLSPTAYTYELLITAYARDNNLDVINEIVQKIWGFNLDGTATTEPGSAKKGTGSPLLPTQHTLNTIANAYGYNGALPSAISIIEAMSRKYDLVIPVSAWLALLMWTSRRSRIHKRPRIGFLPPEAAPRLFKIMTSPPYNVSPGIEAYWLIINHQRQRNNFGSCERLLVDLLKRYGPNGTDLTPETKHLANFAMDGAKNWVPLLCDRLAIRDGDRQRAIATHIRWQQRFHLLETTGMMRQTDEVDESRKTGVVGILKPPPNVKQTSYSIRSALAKKSARQRLIRYARITRQRRMDYPDWHPTRFLYIPAKTRFKIGLGSPRRYFNKSYQLWREHVQGLFTPKDRIDLKHNLSKIKEVAATAGAMGRGASREKNMRNVNVDRGSRTGRQQSPALKIGDQTKGRGMSVTDFREHKFKAKAASLKALAALPKFHSVRFQSKVRDGMKEEVTISPLMREMMLKEKAEQPAEEPGLEGLFVKDEGEAKSPPAESTEHEKEKKNGQLADKVMGVFPKVNRKN